MSETLRSPPLRLSLTPKPTTRTTRVLSILATPCNNPILKTLSLLKTSPDFHFPGKVLHFPGKIGVFNALSHERSLQQEVVDDPPVSVKLQPICSETQFDNVLGEAQQLGQSVIVVWMASWCRKCVYLKPKLEKLAADYYPRLQFYSVDVNNVPHMLVARAEVTKMPTIQLWKDCKKQAEVIGGHKAHLVVNEVREMIDTESNE